MVNVLIDTQDSISDSNYNSQSTSMEQTISESQFFVCQRLDLELFCKFGSKEKYDPMIISWEYKIKLKP